VRHQRETRRKETAAFGTRGLIGAIFMLNDFADPPLP